MNKIELRANYERLINLKTINNCSETLNLIADVLLEISVKEHPKQNIISGEHEAKIICQMMLTKTLHLKNLLQGVDFISYSGSIVKNIIDPMVIAGVIRNTYEFAGLFNLIFIYSQNEVRELLFKLWLHSGLKYRQQFASFATTAESQQKSTSELLRMQQAVQEIRNLSLYINSDQSQKELIDHKIQKKDYKLLYKNGKFQDLSWKEIGRVLGLRDDLFKEFYTYLSLNTHPSIVSVVQFNSMFTTNAEYISTTLFHLEHFFFLVSIFISDYIKFLPSNKRVFEETPVLNQIVINSFNLFSRNGINAINNTMSLLD